MFGEADMKEKTFAEIANELSAKHSKNISNYAKSDQFSKDFPDFIQNSEQVKISDLYSTKTAKTIREAWNMQETYKNKSHAWIQWKGTDACMDIHCDCGWLGHVDTTFLYFIRCPKCKTIYSCNGHIELIKITEEVPDNVVDIIDEDILIDELLDKQEQTTFHS